ncbi:MAG: CPBP family intramembrane glutamic endopeptidase [Anaerolineales bacterium]
MQRRIGRLLLVYFLIRIPLVTLAEALNWTENGLIAPILRLMMYGLIAAMLVVARNSLNEFRVDRFTLFVFVAFGLLASLPAGTDSNFWLGLIYFATALAAVVFAIRILRSRQLRGGWAPFDWNWLVIGLMSSVALRLFLSALGRLVAGSTPLLQTERSITAGEFVIFFISFLGVAAVEELAFRGFLWGYLERRGWKGGAILLFQAALFWVAHLRQIDQPISFWVALPAAGLLLGWLAWKSKSLAASLLAHSIYNTVRYWF